MKIEPIRTALLVIDMEKAFVEPGAALCVQGAKATVPAVEKAVEEARAMGVKVFWIKKMYKNNGSDVENPKREIWQSTRGLLTPDSMGVNSIEEPDGLIPYKDDYMIFKNRWSGFHKTNLEIILNALSIDTVLLAGTATPDSVRETCYDAIAYGYRSIVIENCCSSNTIEIQNANIEDMERAGAEIFYGEELADLVRMDVA